MEQDNAYQAPSSNPLAENTSTEGNIYSGPQKCSSGQGVKWISEGFQLFKAYPGQWIATMVIGFVIMIVINFIPVVGQIVGSLTTFIWVAGLIMGCDAIRKGEEFSLSYLFAAFKSHWLPLLLLSILSTVVSLIVMGIVVGSVYLQLLSGADIDPELFLSPLFWIKMLFGLALLIPLYMAIWFAPTLIVLHDMPIFQAVQESFKGAVKNMVPFLIYGVVLFFMLIVAALPLMLGFLVVMPVLYASIYASYEDIFTQPADNSLEA